MTHTELSTEITDIISKLDDAPKSVNNTTATITYKDEKFDERIKKQPQTLTFQAKENP